MQEEFLRTIMSIGEDGVEKLQKSSVLVFGIGGVGSYVIEALARVGVGKIAVVDRDTVSLSNINRQLIALHSTVGMDKVDVAIARIKDINPDCDAVGFKCFYTAEDSGGIELADYDYIVDAIDTISSKILIAKTAYELDVPIISCMGTGNRMDPSRFRIADIYKTHMCPVAKVMRYELKRRGVGKLKVLFSEEQPIKAHITENGRHAPASISFVPPCAGMMIAGEVIRDLIKKVY